MDLGLAGKTALITGAGAGIGQVTAQVLAAEGVRVIVADIQAERARSAAQEIVAQGNEAIWVEVDVTSAASVSRAFEMVAASFGAPDILVNNAAFTRDQPLVTMPEQDWDAIIDVVLKGAFLCTRAALPAMIERKWGRIISISSRSYLGNPGQGNYAAAKAGLLGFTRALAMEHGPSNITVNAVAPGVVDTAAARALPHFQSFVEKAKMNLPIPRLGRPEDVADAVAFLASERAGYISGDVLHVTGGRY